MKKYILALALLFSAYVQAQVNCGSDHIHDHLLEDNIHYKEQYLKQNEAIRKIIQNKALTKADGEEDIYTIPIVVHIIHQGEAVGSGTNISLNQVYNAIRGLNERYRSMIGKGVDFKMEFCLASRDPQGNPTTGINRIDGSVLPQYNSGGILMPGDTDCEGKAARDVDVKNLSKWPVAEYYNIWVVNKICGGWAGYAYYPWGGETDGTVLLSSSMTYNDLTLAHELGHGFNLAHTFNGDGGNQSCPPNGDCTLDGDFVCDTPPHKQNDCGASSPCGSEGLWNNSRHNYMSYCFPSSANGLFTQGQKDRARASLMIFPRASLLQSLGCTPPPICENVCPSYDFEETPDMGWQNHSSEIAENSCKTYRFPVTSGNTYIFKTGCGDSASADFDTYLELFNDQCSLLRNNDDGCEEHHSTIEWTAYYTGYAYLKISGKENESGSYTLAYRQKSNICNACPTFDYNIIPTTNWQSYSSDLIASACDIYRIAVSKGNSYTYKTGCEDGASAEFDTYMELYDERCSLLSQDDNGCEEKSSSISWVSNYTGYAYLKIRVMGNRGGKYTLAYRQTNILPENCGEGCFVTVWQTDQKGNSDDNQILFPGYGNNYDIFWEEVDNPSNKGYLQGDHITLINLPHPGTYQISVHSGDGDFHRISFPSVESEGDATKLVDVKQWGDTKWSSMSYAFAKCSHLNISAEDAPDLSRVEDVSFMFSESNMNAYIGHWNVGKVKYMTGMFHNASKFNQPIEEWDVGKVIDMSDMFNSAVSFNQSLDKWDVRKVRDMSNMFWGAISFNEKVQSWDVQSVEKMTGMFIGAISFNQDIQNWNVVNVKDMSYMFLNASSFNQPLDAWDVSNVQNMTAMFYQAKSFNQEVKSWDVSNVKNMYQMFAMAESFNHDLGKWHLNKDVNLRYLLYNSGMKCNIYSQTLKGWADNPLTPDTLNLGAESVYYGSDGVSYRNRLLSKGWTIADAGMERNCAPIVTSMNDKSYNADLHIYPNPNHGHFTIYIETPTAEKTTLEIVNILGQIISSEQLYDIQGKKQITRDLSKFGKGVFFINLKHGGKLLQRKLVVQ